MNDSVRLTLAQTETLLRRAKERGDDRVWLYQWDDLVVELVATRDYIEGLDGREETVIHPDGSAGWTRENAHPARRIDA